MTKNVKVFKPLSRSKNVRRPGQTVTDIRPESQQLNRINLKNGTFVGSTPQATGNLREGVIHDLLMQNGEQIFTVNVNANGGPQPPNVTVINNMNIENLTVMHQGSNTEDFHSTLRRQQTDTIPVANLDLPTHFENHSDNYQRPLSSFVNQTRKRVPSAQLHKHVVVPTSKILMQKTNLEYEQQQERSMMNSRSVRQMNEADSDQYLQYENRNNWIGLQPARSHITFKNASQISLPAQNFQRPLLTMCSSQQRSQKQIQDYHMRVRQMPPAVRTKIKLDARRKQSGNNNYGGLYQVQPGQISTDSISVSKTDQQASPTRPLIKNLQSKKIRSVITNAAAFGPNRHPSAGTRIPESAKDGFKQATKVAESVKQALHVSLLKPVTQEETIAQRNDEICRMLDAPTQTTFIEIPQTEQTIQSSIPTVLVRSPRHGEDNELRMSSLSNSTNPEVGSKGTMGKSLDPVRISQGIYLLQRKEEHAQMSEDNWKWILHPNEAARQALEINEEDMRMYTKLTEVGEEKETERLEENEPLEEVKEKPEKKKASIIKSQEYSAYESPAPVHSDGTAHFKLSDYTGVPSTMKKLEPKFVEQEGPPRHSVPEEGGKETSGVSTARSGRDAGTQIDETQKLKSNGQIQVIDIRASHQANILMKQRLEAKAAQLDQQIKADERKIWVMANEVFSSRGLGPVSNNIHFDKSAHSKQLLTKINSEVPALLQVAQQQINRDIMNIEMNASEEAKVQKWLQKGEVELDWNVTEMSHQKVDAPMPVKSEQNNVFGSQNYTQYMRTSHSQPGQLSDAQQSRFLDAHGTQQLDMESPTKKMQDTVISEEAGFLTKMKTEGDGQDSLLEDLIVLDKYDKKMSGVNPAEVVFSKNNQRNKQPVNIELSDTFVVNDFNDKNRNITNKLTTSRKSLQKSPMDDKPAQSYMVMGMERNASTHVLQQKQMPKRLRPGSQQGRRQTQIPSIMQTQQRLSSAQAMNQPNPSQDFQHINVQKLVQDKALNRHISAATGPAYGPTQMILINRRVPHTDSVQQKRNQASSSLRWVSSSYQRRDNTPDKSSNRLRESYNSRLTTEKDSCDLQKVSIQGRSMSPQRTNYKTNSMKIPVIDIALNTEQSMLSMDMPRTQFQHPNVLQTNIHFPPRKQAHRTGFRGTAQRKKF